MLHGDASHRLLRLLAPDPGNNVRVVRVEADPNSIPGQILPAACPPSCTCPHLSCIHPQWLQQLFLPET